MAEVIDVVATPRDNLPAIADDGLVALAAAAEKRIEAVNKIKTLALRVTNAHDWTDQNDKPYLAVSGAEKVARLFGISWRIDPPDMVREEDGHYSFVYKGYFVGLGVEIEVIGTRSSRDEFFSRRKGHDVPPSEIDRNDVMKSALTNLLGNGITRLLGIRNLSWDELTAAGIAKDAVQRVEYRKAEMSEEGQGQKRAVLDMLSEMAGGDEKKIPELLEQMTGFTGRDGTWVPGKRDISKLSERALQVTYGKAKTAYERWQKQQERNGKNGTKAGGKPAEAPTPEAKPDGRLV